MADDPYAFATEVQQAAQDDPYAFATPVAAPPAPVAAAPPATPAAASDDTVGLAPGAAAFADAGPPPPVKGLDKPVQGLPQDQGLGFADATAGAVNRLAQRGDRALQSVGVPMDRINQFFGFPTADQAVSQDQKVIADAAARGVVPGQGGKTAGVLATGLATAPMGLLAGGALTGALESDAPVDDTHGFLKDVSINAALNKVGGEALDKVVMPAIGDVAARVATKLPNPKSVISGLQGVKDRAYDYMKGLNLQYSPEAIQGLQSNIQSIVHNFGGDSTTHGPVFTYIDKLMNRTTASRAVPSLNPDGTPELDQNWKPIMKAVQSRVPMSLYDLETEIRAPLSRMIGDGKSQTQALAAQVHSAVDSFIKNATGADLTGANASNAAAQLGTQANTAARAANTRFQNAVEVNSAMRGGKPGVGYPGWNITKKAVQGLQPIVDASKSFLSPTEQAAAGKVVSPGALQSTLRAVGKASPFGGDVKQFLMNAAANEGVGLLSHHPLLSAVEPAVTSAAKFAADASTKARLGNLFDVIQGGGGPGAGAAARTARANALKNSSFGRWVAAGGRDLGEYARILGSNYAIQQRAQSQQQLDQLRQAQQRRLQTAIPGH